jgi:peptide chain release factor 1
MIDKLEDIAKRRDELNSLLSDPEVVQDNELFQKYAKEHAEIDPLVSKFNEYKKAQSELEGGREILAETEDKEMREMAQAEVDELEQRSSEIMQELTVLLLPKDPDDEKNIIIEIRAGTGGDEAALFGSDLFTMYTRFAEAQRWSVEVLSSSESSVGGFKEVIAQVTGKGAYSQFKFESGVHRVQRVPKTETQGRIHTSTVTVAVLPEAKEVEIDIEEKDLRIDVFRASGPGGQSVNTTDSAVRVTHIPTGMVATCQDGKSQHKNKAKALTVLRSRLYEKMLSEQQSERSENRRSQIGSGERSEKIRTYNFPQGRITDHRIGLTIYQLDTVLGGDLAMLVEPIAAHFQAEALQAAE